jgi:hypothetical protein
MPVFQPLKDRQVIPLRPGCILRVCGIRWWPQLNWRKKTKKAQPNNKEGRQGKIH